MFPLIVHTAEEKLNDIFRSEHDVEADHVQILRERNVALLTRLNGLEDPLTDLPVRKILQQQQNIQLISTAPIS